MVHRNPCTSFAFPNTRHGCDCPRAAITDIELYSLLCEVHTALREVNHEIMLSSARLLESELSTRENPKSAKVLDLDDSQDILQGLSSAIGFMSCCGPRKPEAPMERGRSPMPGAPPVDLLPLLTVLESERAEIRDAPAVTPPPLSEPTQNILSELSDFLASRDTMLEAANACLPQFFIERFPSFGHVEHLRQSTRDGDIACSYDDLLTVADEAALVFTMKMASLVLEAGLDPDAPAVYDGAQLMLDAETPFTHLTVASLKSRERCEEKAHDECDGDFSLVLDVTRCSIVVADEAQLIAVGELLARLAQPLDVLRTDDGGGARMGDFVVVRLKNRFGAPLYNGYRDALYTIALHMSDGLWALCEVQVHLAPLLVHKAASHACYESYRELFPRGVAQDERLAIFERVGATRKAPDKVVAYIFHRGDAARLEALGALAVATPLEDHPLRVAVLERLVQVDAAADGELDVKSALRRKHQLGLAQLRAGSHQAAEATLRPAVDMCAVCFGDGSEITLAATHDLANALQAQNNLDEAEEMARRALQGRDVHLGPAHSDTLESAYLLAVLLDKHGRLVEAEPLHVRCLEANEATLGLEHPETLRSVATLAFALQKQGKLDEAVPYARRALEGRERVLGLEHIETLISRSNLADLLREHGDADGAAVTLGETAAKVAEVVGATHEVTLVTEAKEARISLSRTGDTSPLRKVLQRLEDHLGDDHPQTCKYAAVLSDAQGWVEEE